MPRPAEGYANAAGAQVPGVSDILKEYCPKPALVQWAYKRGRAGVPLYDEATLDIGTVVHSMAELNLRGRSEREIEARLYQVLSKAEDILAARKAYQAFCAWRDRVQLQPLANEVSIVNETWQLGGTPDCIAYLDGRIGVLDFKTCGSAPGRPYNEQLLGMAAHARLWNEANPDRAAEVCHIIYLPKDGAPHAHHKTNRLGALWDEFSHLLRAYVVKYGTPAPIDGREAEIARLREEIARGAATEAGKTLRAFAPPPPSRRPMRQLAMDLDGTKVLPLADAVLAKRPAAPSIKKPRVRLHADGSWSYVQR